MTIRTLTFFISLLTLIVTITNPSIAFAQSADPVTVEVTGRGLTTVDARKDAIMNALRQVVGEYVESDTVIENEEIVTDTITAFSNAESVKSEVISKAFEGENIVVVCRVTIVPAQIVGKIRDAALSAVNIDGEALAAELEANQDNIELQKETIERLFKGIAPRLLVARLVDRSGNPIKDGRIPKSDIMDKGDNVLIALNIQIYYDLEAYYEKVYPNLQIVLKAVANSYFPSVVNSTPREHYDNIATQAFSNYPSAKKNWLMQSNKLGELIKKSGIYSFALKINPRQFAVLLSRSRDKYGLDEFYDGFLLPIELAPNIMKWNHQGNSRQRESATLPMMRIVLESQSGQTITTNTIQIMDNATSNKRRAYGRDTQGLNEPIPFQEPFWRLSRIHSSNSYRFLTWLFNSDNSLDYEVSIGKYPLVISPRFGWTAGNDTLEFGDSVLLREYITVPKDEFQHLGKISFDFWDPRAN